MTTRDEKRARELVEAALDDEHPLRFEFSVASLLSAAQVYASLALAGRQAQAIAVQKRSADIAQQFIGVQGGAE